MQPAQKVQYDADTQLVYMGVFLARPDLYNRMLKVHRASHYSPTVKKAVEFVDSYFEEFSTLPDHSIIEAKTGVSVPKLEGIDHGHEEWFMKEYPKFSLHKSLESALYKADEQVQNQNYDAMESILNEAYEVRLGFDYGIMYDEDPAGRLKNILDRSGNITYGWAGVDGTVGKLNRGDLIIYVGPSGGGKSLFLQNHAVNHWKNGMNVLQITLELHPELVSRRMDCMFLNKSQDELYVDLSATAMEFAMEKKKHNVGELRVKYMPSGTKTSEIKNLVKMYMNDTKKPVDVLIVDYIDLVDPVGTYKAGDTFNKDKMVSEELRNIGQELGPIVISASQLNRSGVGLDELDHSNISGGISKINTADMVFGIITNNEMRESGSYELQVLKSRNSAGTGRKIPMKINPGTMRIVDDPEYIAKIGQYLKMSTHDANKDRHKSEVQSEYDKLMDAIKPPSGETSGESYGSKFETSNSANDTNSNGMPSAEPVSGEQAPNKPTPDNRMSEIRNLINKSMR